MKIFSRFPVFRVVIPFSIGIIVTIKCEVSLSAIAVTAVAGLILSALFTFKNYATGKYAQRWLAGIPFYCCFFGLGALLTWTHQSINYKNHFSNFPVGKNFIAEIKTEPVQTKNGCRFIVKACAVSNSCNWIPVNGNLLVYVKDSLHNFQGVPGDKLALSGNYKSIQGPANPNAFDALTYYAGKGTWHRIYVNDDAYRILSHPVTKTPFDYSRQLRDIMLSKLRNYLDKEELGVAGALLLGYEEWLDPDLETQWSGAGVLHVLCVSGMHVMLIYVILAGLTGWMEKNWMLRQMRYLLLMALIWFYAMVTGFSPSVIRAAAMITFVIAGNWINREASIYNLLCSSCILMFVMDPYLIVSAGFQLSFLAVCGIIFLHKLILPLWTAPNKILHKIWELISVSLAAQLSTFPLSLYLFHQFPNYFLIANLVIIPLSTLVMYSGLILLVTDWIPYAGTVMGFITTWGIRMLNRMVIFIGEIPGALTQNIYLSFGELVILYGLLLFITVWLVYKSRTWLFVCMILLVLGFFIRIELLRKATSKVQLTVYDNKGKSLVTVIHGRNATIFTDSIQNNNRSMPSSEHLLSNLVESPVQLKIRRNEVCKISGVPGREFIIIKDWKRYNSLADSFHISDDPVLIMGGELQAEASELEKIFHPAKVIFDSSCKRYQVAFMEKSLHKLGIATCDVSKTGAYQYP